MTFPNFVPYFKKRFEANDLALLQNENLFFDIDDLLDARKKLEAFISNVTRPLSDEVFDAVERFQRRASLTALASEINRINAMQIKQREEHLIIGQQHMEQEFDRALAQI